MTWGLFRVFAGDSTRVNVDDEDLIAWGVQFRSGWCILEYRRDAFPPEDRLDHNHISIYGSLHDVEKGTGGRVSPIDDLR